MQSSFSFDTYAGGFQHGNVSPPLGTFQQTIPAGYSYCPVTSSLVLLAWNAQCCEYCENRTKALVVWKTMLFMFMTPAVCANG